MKTLRIPRKDHDVYCIDITGKPWREVQAYIEKQLVLLHPVVGTDTISDIKRLKYNEHEWALVTVMQRAVLEEYRILYPRIPFVTATSLAVFKKDFFAQKAQECGCERIWFDAQAQLIVSEEYRIMDGKQEQEELVRCTERRSIVFTSKQRVPLLIGIGIGIVLTVLLAVYAVWTAHKAVLVPVVQPKFQAAAEREAAKVPYITAVRFLEIIADRTPAMHAVLERYRFADTEGLLCTFRGMSLEAIVSVFEAVPYRTGCVVKELIQNDRETVVTIQTEPVNRAESWSTAAEPAVLAGFMDALKADVLETKGVKALQTEDSGKIIKNDIAAASVHSLQITMSGGDIMLIALVKTAGIDAFLYTIETVCNQYRFGIIVLEVLIAEKGMLSVHAEFRKSVGNIIDKEQEHKAGHSMQVIARAFGYAEPASVKEVPVPIQTVQNHAVVESVVSAPVIPEGSVEIGKIKTGEKTKIYYRTPDGKIMSVESNSL